MPNDTVDLLQIKIEKAKRELPEETLNAIATIDWRIIILQLREKRGYSFEQLGDLELETELLLCGLMSPADYPKELERRMGISKASANELVNEMNELVFKKIREELIKNVERKKIFANKKATSTPIKVPASITEKDTQTLNRAGIEIIDVKKESLPTPELPLAPKTQKIQTEKLEIAGEAHPILAQKLSGPYQAPVVKTEHTLESISKTNTPNPLDAKPKIPTVDPYREIPE